MSQSSEILHASRCLPFGHALKATSSFMAKSADDRRGGEGVFRPYVRVENDAHRAYVTDGNGKVLFRHADSFEKSEDAALAAYEAARIACEQLETVAAPQESFRPRM